MMSPAKLLRPGVRLTLAAVSRDRVIGEDLKNAQTAAVLLRNQGYEVTLAYWSDLDEGVVG